MIQRNAKARLPLRTALRCYWPFLLGITSFHILVVFDSAISTNQTLLLILFFVAILPAMWPYLFASAPYSFWAVAALYWFFGYLLTIALKVLLFSALGWEL